MKDLFAPAVGLFALTVFANGCVPYQTYDDLKDEYEIARKVNDDLTAKLNRVVQEYNRLRGGDQFSGATIENLRERLANSQQTNERLAQEIQDLKNDSLAGSFRFTDEDVGAIGSGASLDVKSGSLVLSEALLFNSGRADLKGRGAMDALDSLARILRERYPNETFHIVGHTDNEPLKQTAELWKTNLNLGYQRAYKVFEYLTKEHGLKEGQFMLHSYGFLRPVDPATANTPAGRAKNRRVEIYRAGARI